MNIYKNATSDQCETYTSNIWVVISAQNVTRQEIGQSTFSQFKSLQRHEDEELQVLSTEEATLKHSYYKRPFLH